MFKFFRILIITFVILIIAFSVIGWLVDGFGEEKPKKPFPNSAFKTIDNVELHYRIWGSDSAKGTIVFIHGFCGSTFNWRNNIDTLIKQNYQIIAIDLPAFGYSDRNSGIDHTNTNRINLVIKLLTEIFPDVAKFHFVGHSMGGGMVAQLAFSNPEKVATTTLVDAAIMMPKSKGVFSFLIDLPPFRGFVAVLAKFYLFSDSNIKQLVTSAYAIETTQEAIDGYRNPLLLKRTSGAILDQFLYSNNSKIVDLAKINTPTLIIWGDKDVWVPLSWSGYIQNTIPKSEMVIISNAGHCPMETHPKEFNEAFVKFLERNAN